MSGIKPTLKLRGNDHARLQAAAKLVLHAGDRRTAEILLSLAGAVEQLVPHQVVPSVSEPAPLPRLFDLDDETEINLADPDDGETVMLLVPRHVPDADPSVFDEPDEALFGRTPTPRVLPVTGSGHIRNLMPREPSGPARGGVANLRPAGGK